MATDRDYPIDGRMLRVANGIIADDELPALGAEAQGWPGLLPAAFGGEAQTRRRQQLETPLGPDLGGHPLAQRITRAVAALFPGPRLVPRQARYQRLVYGDLTPIAPRGSRLDVTALVYLHARWRPEWGGETFFFNRRGDVAWAVTPRPGRLCVFPSDVEYRLGVPLRACFDSLLAVRIEYAPVLARAGVRRLLEAVR